MDIIGRGRRRRARRRRQELEAELFSWRFLAEKRHDQLKDFIHKKSTIQQKTTSHEKTIQSEFQLTLLPHDLLFKIFILIPAESLYKLQFVCKKWFDLINTSIFIQFHNKQSDSVLISKETFFSETDPSFFIGSSRSKPHFHYVDFDCGIDNFIEVNLSNNSVINIKASYDGLILAVIEMNKTLILMNPLTRKQTKLPAGTIGFDESYSLLFCSEARTYKVVHLFREPTGYTGCEILNISTREWTIVDGPCSSLLEDIRLMPVSVDGSLNWMPQGHGNDSFLSMNVMDKKFVKKKLPILCAMNDRLVEIGGVLGFVTHATLSLIQVWMLMRDGGVKEKWIKRYSLYLRTDARFVVPICSSRNGKEMVFEYPGNELYIYKFETGVLKKIYSRDDEKMENRLGAEKLFIPHRNTLVSWNHYQLS